MGSHFFYYSCRFCLSVKGLMSYTLILLHFMWLVIKKNVHKQSFCLIIIIDFHFLESYEKMNFSDYECVMHKSLCTHVNVEYKN